MMFEKVLTYLLEGNAYQSLEVHGTGEGEGYSLLKLLRRKGELEVVSAHRSGTLEGIVGKLDAKMPLFLTINTSMVLKKMVAAGDGDVPEFLLASAFPNLGLDNFYYQLFRSGGNAVLAIAKREYVQGHLDQLEGLGARPFQVSLGACAVGAIAGAVEGTVTGSNFSIDIGRDGLRGLVPSGTPGTLPMDIGGLALTGDQVLAFSHVLGHLNGSAMESNLGGLCAGLANAHRNGRLFQLGTRASLAFFLVLLSVNFLLFEHYRSENRELESFLASTRLRDGSLEELRERVERKRERLGSLTRSKGSRASLFLDELGRGVPGSVYLSDVRYRPLLAPVRGDRPIELSENGMQVSGVTNDKLEFTVWSDNLQTRKWVHRVDIMDYEYISRSSAKFTLNLILNDVR